MKSLFAFLVLFVLLLGCTGNEIQKKVFDNYDFYRNNTINNSEVVEMKLTSSAFKQGEFIPKKYTCDGENVNPPLKISDVPSNTTSLVLIVDDPDAPMGTFTHWVEVLSANTKEIPENIKISSGWRIKSDFGKAGYGGPCPPSGQHTYRFKLYAVDIAWPATVVTPSKNDIESMMKDHILATAELDGEYQRQ